MSVQNTAPTRRSRREAEKKKAVSRGKGRKIAVNIAKVFTLLLLTAALLLSAVVGLCYVVFKGPSEAARDLLVVSAMETSAMKFVPRVFFTQEEIDERELRKMILAEEQWMAVAKMKGLPETVIN